MREWKNQDQRMEKTKMPRLNYRKKLILNGLYFQYIIMYIFTVSNEIHDFTRKKYIFSINKNVFLIYKISYGVPN